MMRYFCYLTSWLACWLAAHVPAHADTATSMPSQQHFAPMNDWQLPSFVAQDSSSGDKASNPSQARTSTVTHVSLNFGASHSSAARDAKPSKTALTSKPGSSHSSVALNSKSEPIHPLTQPSASTKPGVDHPILQAIAATTKAARHEVATAKAAFEGRLARLTAYWAGEGDYYTGRHLSSTGIRLHGGLCAVDPSIIPYGSVVVIPGVGQFLAADTGSAVVSREAAREAGRTLAERKALVIDIFFDTRREGEAFTAQQPKFVPISWWTPSSTSHAAQEARSVFADENWNKIYSKQL
jgi:3D (Asp-Asp-Asp) domain-containing protein